MAKQQQQQGTLSRKKGSFNHQVEESLAKVTKKNNISFNYFNISFS